MTEEYTRLIRGGNSLQKLKVPEGEGKDKGNAKTYRSGEEEN